MAGSFCRTSLAVVVSLALFLTVSRVAQAADQMTKAEYEKLKKEVEDLRRQLSTATPVASKTAAVDQALDNKYGPNAAVTTKQGKLTLGGLVQVWYYSIQNDRVGYVDPNEPYWGVAQGGAFGSNEVNDNDGFRIRRAELKFTMDIHENITAVVMIDPAREATSYPNLPQNQANALVAFSDFGWPAAGNPRNAAVQNGAGGVPRLLQDAYINMHGVLPHHDSSVGQMKRRLGEEGTRDSSQLDFVERSMITQLADLRDIGALTHGTWWDDRFQYWMGAFNGAGSAFQQLQNRANDNDHLDAVLTLLIRPLWKDETWGSIELGWSGLYGTGGESGGHQPGTNPVDGLNRRTTTRVMQYAWGCYKPGGPVKGWWMRGEWGQYRDRFAPNAVGPFIVSDPAPFNVQGWYVSTGYKLDESIWADGLCKWAKPMEFTFRYDTMQNLFVPDLNLPTRRQDVFSTEVFTAGLNYYIKGHNAKVQVNYNWVQEEARDNKLNGVAQRPTRAVRNDNLMVNFQVAW